MAFSKIKTKFKTFLPDYLKDHIDIQMRAYTFGQQSFDQYPTIAISFDKENIIITHDSQAYMEKWYGIEGHKWLKGKYFDTNKFLDEFRFYISNKASIEETETNKYKLIFSILDRRIGKRKLPIFKKILYRLIEENNNPELIKLYQLVIPLREKHN